MTFEQIIYDIRLILRATTDDSRISDAYLLRKILNYRSIYILDAFLQTAMINTQWVQRLGNKKLTPVNSSDNPAIEDGTVKMGKMTLPNLISLGSQRGIYRISDTQRQKQVYDTNWPTLMLMIQNKDSRLKLFRYYCNISNEYYIYPYISEVDVMAVLDNPLDGIQFKTELIDLNDIQVGEQYFVLSGSVKGILNNTTVIYTKHTEFTGESGYIYSGDGKIRLVTQMLPEVYNKDFYMDSAIGQRVVLEILTKDFAIERSAISDIVNDSADQTKLLTAK